MKSVRKGPCPSKCSFLAGLKQKKVTWQAFSDPQNRAYAAQKEVLRKALLEIHRHQCVYCESPVKEDGSKIEHFFPRSRHGDRVFDWDNLFISCDCTKTCSDWKDGPRGKSIALSQMFRPDDPNVKIEDCFDCEDGWLCAASTTTDAEKALVQGTIDKANLNYQDLVSKRRRLTQQVMSYVDPQTGTPFVSAADIKRLFAGRGFDSLLERLVRRFFQ